MNFSPVPKPPARLRLPSKYGSTIPQSSKGPNKVSKRRPSEKLRIYGTSQRRAFIRKLDCSACGASGFSQNAHVFKIGAGMGYKGDAAGIAPLCGPRYNLVGCHAMLDQHRDKFFARFPWYQPEVIAAETDRAWLAFVEAEGDA